MKENNIGLAFRIIGTLYVMYKIASLFILALQDYGPVATWHTVVIAMVMGMLSIFFIWIGAETIEEKEKK